MVVLKYKNQLKRKGHTTVVVSPPIRHKIQKMTTSLLEYLLLFFIIFLWCTILFIGVLVYEILHIMNQRYGYTSIGTENEYDVSMA